MGSFGKEYQDMKISLAQAFERAKILHNQFLQKDFPPYPAFLREITFLHTSFSEFEKKFSRSFGNLIDCGDFEEMHKGISMWLKRLHRLLADIKPFYHFNFWRSFFLRELFKKPPSKEELNAFVEQNKKDVETLVSYLESLHSFFKLNTWRKQDFLLKPGNKHFLAAYLGVDKRYRPDSCSKDFIEAQRRVRWEWLYSIALERKNREEEKIDLSDVYLRLRISNVKRMIWLNLDRAIMDEANLLGVEITDCSFKEVILVGSNLSVATISTVDFDGARLDTTDLTGTVFRDCSFQGVLFMGAKLTGTDFVNCDVTDANFEQTSGLTREQVYQMKNWRSAALPMRLGISTFRERRARPEGSGGLSIAQAKGNQGGLSLIEDVEGGQLSVEEEEEEN